MRNYLILRERALAFRADPEVRAALEAARVEELSTATVAPGEPLSALRARRLRPGLHCPPAASPWRPSTSWRWITSSAPADASTSPRRHPHRRPPAGPAAPAGPGPNARVAPEPMERNPSPTKGIVMKKVIARLGEGRAQRWHDRRHDRVVRPWARQPSPHPLPPRAGARCHRPPRRSSGSAPEQRRAVTTADEVAAAAEPGFDALVFSQDRRLPARQRSPRASLPSSSSATAATAST